MRNDVVLPRAFRDVSVFIDDCCDASSPAMVFNSGVLDFELYLFLNNYQSIAWVLLDNGGLISSSTTLGRPASLASAAASP